LARAALPESWSIVLAVPAASPGLSGAAEQEALGRLGPLPAATTAELCRLALDELLPAALAVDFARFSQALFAYGQLAGSCFAASQGGAFRGDCVAPLVDLLRSWGVVGVGQSSWGPAIFALQPDLTHGQLLRERLRPEVRGGQVWLARPHNAGAPCTIADA
jgi:predicted sugar kinase